MDEHDHSRAPRLWPFVLAAAALFALWFGWVASAGATNRAGVAASYDPAAVAVAQIEPAQASSATTGQTARAAQIVRVDPAWLAATASATGIPPRALSAYAAAILVVAAENPHCSLGWNTVAAIGEIESGHGSHGGAVLDAAGYSTPRIVGPALMGESTATISDTDQGKWDGDSRWDHAVGPMQFIPSTWQRWGADGNGDGVADPNQIDDAALATARYLCSSGSLTTATQWRSAVFSYNHLDSYVDAVAAIANRYSASVAAG